MEFEGLGPSLSTLARCVGSSMVFCRAWTYTEEAMCLQQENIVIVIDNTTQLQERQLCVLRWDIMSCLALISRVLCTLLQKCPKRHGRVWNLKPIETRTQKNPKRRIHNCRIYTVAWLLFWIAKIFSIVSVPCRVQEVLHVFSKSNVSGWWAMLSALKLFVWL